MTDAALRRTPFHEVIAPLNKAEAWERWQGYVAATRFYDTGQEYAAIRNTASLYDISPMLKYRVTGPDAARFVNRLITRDIDRCRPGRCFYTPWCNGEGHIIEDGTIFRFSEDVFQINCADRNLTWFLATADGLDVRIEDVSEHIAALSLQGPLAREVLLKAGAKEAETLKYFGLVQTRIGDAPVTLTRTGFTGDLGYEIWMAAADAPAIWDTLMDAGAGYGIAPTGMLALDMARVEAGLLLIDVDYTPARKARIEGQKSSPFELDLGWTVNLNKSGNFNGRRALAQEKVNGSHWATVGLEVDWNALEAAYARAGLSPAVPHTAWRSSVPLYGGSGLGRERQVGYATSGCFSPILKRYIALATVEPKYSQLGSELLMEVTVEHVPRKVLVRVVEKPFFDPPRKKA